MTLFGMLKVLPLCLPLLLTACEDGGTKGVYKYNLANVPPDIRQCFTVLTGKPVPGAMSEKEAVALIGKLRASEVSKTYCGRRLLALYDGQSVIARKK